MIFPESLRKKNGILFFKENLLPFLLVKCSKPPKASGLLTVMTSNSTTCNLPSVSMNSCLVHVHSGMHVHAQTHTLISHMYTGLILALFHTDMVFILQWGEDTLGIMSLDYSKKWSDLASGTCSQWRKNFTRSLAVSTSSLRNMKKWWIIIIIWKRANEIEQNYWVKVLTPKHTMLKLRLKEKLLCWVIQLAAN